jgi:hypothetical protein
VQKYGAALPKKKWMCYANASSTLTLPTQTSQQHKEVCSYYCRQWKWLRLRFMLLLCSRALPCCAAVRCEPRGAGRGA